MALLQAVLLFCLLSPNEAKILKASLERPLHTPRGCASSSILRETVKPGMARCNTATATQDLRPRLGLRFSQAWSIHAAPHQSACLLPRSPAKGIILVRHFHWGPFPTASEGRLAPHSLTFGDARTSGPFRLNVKKLLSCPIASLLSTVIQALPKQFVSGFPRHTSSFFAQPEGSQRLLESAARTSQLPRHCPSLKVISPSYELSQEIFSIFHFCQSVNLPQLGLYIML